MTTKVLYLHGYGARPGGFKPTFLRESGFEVVNPGLPDDDFDESLQIARESLAQSVPDVVVGSSRGGAVALELDLQEIPCVLIAPAWKRFRSSPRVGRRMIILHSEHDETIPLEDSRELVRKAGLPDDALVVIGENHYMADEGALAALVEAIEKVAGR